MRCAGPACRIEAHFATFGDRPAFADVLPLARLITDDFLAEKYGRVDIVYSRWVSTLVQRPTLDPAPADPRDPRTRRASPATSSSSSPAPGAVLEQLLPRYVATRLFQAVLEAKASEESSRMVAMKNATENAEELIEDLTLSLQQGPPGQHHPRNDRDRVRRERSLTLTGRRRQPNHGDRHDQPRPAGSSRSPDPSSTSSSRPASCPRSTTRSRSSARARTRSCARSSSTSATTGSAPWP